MLNGSYARLTPKGGGSSRFGMGALKRRLTRQQLMDGGSIAEARASVKVQGGRLTIHYGTSMIDDPRLSALLDREAKFLNVLMPRGSCVER